MKRNKVVLDSSAVLAMIQGEPGGDRVDALLGETELDANREILISTVNWCEILTCLQRDKIDITSDWLASIFPVVDVVPFSAEDAEKAAAIAKKCRNLSLGDRACLALAQSRNATAWTTDKIWAELALDVALEVLR